MKAPSFLFLLFGAAYCASSVSGVDPFTLASAAAAAVSAISGTAYTAMSLGGGTPLVTVDIIIENWTQWTLWNQLTHVAGGVVPDLGGLHLPPATKTTVRAEKTALTATGSYGAISLQVGDSDLNRRVWIMWSVPYDHNLYYNWLALGISYARFTDARRAWLTMYYSGQAPPQTVFNQQYINRMEIIPVTAEDNSVLVVEGLMGTGRTPTVRVIVRPLNEDYLAMPIQQELRRRK